MSIWRALIAYNSEIMSIRQMIGGELLPDFVGNIDSEAPYRPE
jgi:hypothetical protein